MAQSWKLAPSLVQLRKEIKGRWPTRQRSLDGSIGDAAHRARVSEHNPDSNGIVRAIDIDVRSNGKYSKEIANAILDAVIKDPRIHYVVHNRKIYSRTYGWVKRNFGGIAHENWIHVSLRNNSSNSATPSELAQSANDTSKWFSSAPTSSPEKPKPKPKPKPTETVLKIGSTGAAVKRLQRALNTQFPNYAEWVKPKGGNGKKLALDGIYGKQTELWVAEYQSRSGLTSDGIYGPLTRAKLGVS